MTFEEAMDRLPKCSWAVNKDGSYVEVWLLYYQDATEIRDPAAEDGPRLEAKGVNVVGEEFGDHLVAGSPFPENASEEIKGLEWRPAEVGLEEFMSAPNPAVRVRVLKGEPLEEATEADEWPEEVEAIAEKIREEPPAPHVPL